LWQNKAKLSIIEQEFSHAEKSEYWRQKEEEEMRRRVQLKRHQMLDQVRRDDKLIKMKEDRKIRQGNFFVCKLKCMGWGWQGAEWSGVFD
jgi:hypothetical protein